jgi:hypothetical protein
MLDQELVELYVDEYISLAGQLYNDLAYSICDHCDVMGEPDPEPNVMRDALADCMADRICDSEQPKKYLPEIRKAAEIIAKRIV